MLEILSMVLIEMILIGGMVSVLLIRFFGFLIGFLVREIMLIGFF